MIDASEAENTLLPTNTGRPVVLIVDDDPTARALAEAALDIAGFISCEAENGQEAIDVFARRQPDIVLLDIMMPVMDGYEVCKLLRNSEDGAAVPIVVMTALEDAESVQRAYELGATDFIVKPVNATLLAHRANYVLRTHRHHVQYDALTGLPKRDLFLEHLVPELNRANRHGRIAALLMLGIDGFDRINTSFGHTAGDRLLRAYANRLTKILRSEDLNGHIEPAAADAVSLGMNTATIARLGGDEFAVALLDIRSPRDAGAVASRICKDLATFVIDENEISMTTSVGISVYPVDSEDPHALLTHAGAALSYAKAHGTNEYQFYTEPLNLQARRRFYVESQLRKALGRGEMRLHYQPQVELKTNRLLGAESLLRWTNEELGEISPGEFIPVAEETGLMREITEWTLQQACRYMASCHRDGMSDLSISVNLSAVQFREDGMARTIADIVDASGLAAKHVKLELTETALFDDMDRAITTLGELQEHGFDIEVDDFGTGYSSLNYLTRLPVSALKIDRSFVSKSTLSDADAAVVNIIIGLGHTLGHRIIAEGVESIEQLEFLVQNGCDVGQGFLFSRALSGTDFRGWAARWCKSEAFSDEDENVQYRLYLLQQNTGT